MKTVALTDVASVIRSKNAGPYELTLDILFTQEKDYLHVKKHDIINSQLISRLYGITHDNIIKIVFFDPAWAVKITLVRTLASGSVGDTDIYGAQQHAPLFTIRIPVYDSISETL